MGNIVSDSSLIKPCFMCRWWILTEAPCMVHFRKSSDLVILPHIPERSAGKRRQVKHHFHKNGCLSPHRNLFPIKLSRKTNDDLFGYVVLVSCFLRWPAYNLSLFVKSFYPRKKNFFVCKENFSVLIMRLLSLQTYFSLGHPWVNVRPFFWKPLTLSLCDKRHEIFGICNSHDMIFIFI